MCKTYKFTFDSTKPSSYLGCYMYYATIWHPHIVKYFRVLGSVQSYFERRLSYRCELETGNSCSRYPSIDRWLWYKCPPEYRYGRLAGSLHEYPSVGSPTGIYNRTRIHCSAWHHECNCFAWRWAGTIREKGIMNCLKLTPSLLRLNKSRRWPLNMPPWLATVRMPASNAVVYLIVHP